VAEKVREGFPLNEAYEAAMKVKAAPETDKILRERLAREAPDLMAIVQDGKMNVREALAALDERIKYDLDCGKVATGNLVRIINCCGPAELRRSE
jgi:hypothetical protein